VKGHPAGAEVAAYLNTAAKRVLDRLSPMVLPLQHILCTSVRLLTHVAGAWTVRIDRSRNRTIATQTD